MNHLIGILSTQLKTLWNTKSVRYIAIAALVVVAFLSITSITRSCDEKHERKIYELQGRYDAYKEKVDQEKGESAKFEAESSRVISNLKAEMLTLKSDAQEIRKENEKISIEKLETMEKLELELEESRNFDGLIANFRVQRDDWKTKYFLEFDERLKETNRADKATIALNISEESRAMLRETLISMESLLQVSEDLSIEKDKKIRRIKRASFFKQILWSTGTFAAGYFFGDKL